MAILRGFSAKNLPNPEVFLEVCTHISLPLDCGRTVARTSVKKLISWIENNVPPKAASELIDHKMVPKYNKAAYEIHVSEALTAAVRREDFSFARDILGGVVRDKHSKLGYTYYKILNPSTMGSSHTHDGGSMSNILADQTSRVHMPGQ